MYSGRASPPTPLGPNTHGPQIVCGNRAGAVTILLDEQRRWGSPKELPEEQRPHFIAASLREVQQVLQHELAMVPPAAPPQPLT